jgi:hypothetical protein
MTHDERCENRGRTTNIGWGPCQCAERALAQAQEEMARLNSALQAIVRVFHQDHTSAPFERCRAATCKLARAALGMP